MRTVTIKILNPIIMANIRNISTPIPSSESDVDSPSPPIDEDGPTVISMVSVKNSPSEV